MFRWLLRPLDRYVLREWTKIFLSTSFGFPFIITVFDLTDNLDKYLNRQLNRADIALSYLYWIPDSLSYALPAAVLFATVFSIAAFTRHSEITAAKASGISFHRLALPIVFGALIATGLGLLVGEVAPASNKRRWELLKESSFSTAGERFNFAFAGERGRVYRAAFLKVQAGTIDGLEIERKGRENDPTYPTYILSAAGARYTDSTGWTTRNGALHVLNGPGLEATFSFDSLRDRHFVETPRGLTASPKAPTDMGYEDLGRFIQAQERSGSDVNLLRVERALKIAVPATCVIIAFFGMALATSNQRGGTAFGIGLSLGTTVVFLVMIQLTKAIGGRGVVTPDVAAWIPNMVFGVLGLVALLRVRT